MASRSQRHGVAGLYQHKTTDGGACLGGRAAHAEGGAGAARRLWVTWSDCDDGGLRQAGWSLPVGLRAYRPNLNPPTVPVTGGSPRPERVAVWPGLHEKVVSPTGFEPVTY